jgi:flavin-dependent dehydrogenase
MPGTLRHLVALGIDPPGHDIRGITYRQDGFVARAAFRNGCGRGVRRTVLHEALRAAAHERGIPVRQAEVARVERASDHVEAAGVRARYGVAADGLHSSIRAAVGLSAHPSRGRRHPYRWGLRRHYQVAPDTDHVEVHWAGASEAYVTPVASDAVGVAILSSARKGFDDQLMAFPELAERLAQATPVSSVRGAGPLRQGVTGRVAGRILLVGDAAGYIDALTGEGLGLSLAAAAELVNCLAADRPDSYDRAWAKVSRRSRWLTGGLLWARSRPALAARVVPFAARAPRLFAAAVDQLAR